MGGRDKVAHRPSRMWFFLMRIEGGTSRRPGGRGGRVSCNKRKLNNRRNMWWYKGEAKVDGTVVCEAEVSAMLVLE